MATVKKAIDLTAGSLSDSTIVIIGDPTSGNYLKSTLGLLKTFLGGATRQSIADTNSIPFTFAVTTVAPHTMSGPLTITPNTTGALSGFGGYQRIIGDGTNTPVFSGFKKWNSSKPFVTTSGAVNTVVYYYDGIDYWYSISQEAAAPSLPQLATPSVSFDSIGSDNMRLVIAAAITNATSYIKEISTAPDFSSIFANSISSSLNASFFGLTPGTTYYGRARATASGYTDSNNGTTSAATSSAGDTTPPVLVSAVIQNGSPQIVLLTYNEALGAVNPAAGKFSVLVNGSANVVIDTLVTGNTVSVALTTALVDTDTIVASYTPGSSGNRTQDVAGNFAIGFTTGSGGVPAVVNNLSSSNGTPAYVPVGTDSGGAFAPNTTWTMPANWTGNIYGSPLMPVVYDANLTTQDITQAMAIQFTKGAKMVVDFDPGLLADEWYYQIDTGSPVPFTAGGKAFGDVLFEIHPNTTTTKTLYIGRNHGVAGGPAGVKIGFAGITLYS